LGLKDLVPLQDVLEHKTQIDIRLSLGRGNDSELIIPTKADLHAFSPEGDAY
jgi:hypothetical protein